MTDFQGLFTAFFDEFVELQPVAATGIGDHRHDARWPDGSEAGRQRRLAFAERWLAAFAALDAATLTADEVVDRDLVTMELEAQVFSDTELRAESWDPLDWVYVLG